MGAEFFFAERWGWTPEQVDGVPLQKLDDLRDMAITFDRWRAEQRREADG